MILFHAYVYGTPRPQPRPRFVNGRVVSTASKVVKLWRGLLFQEFRNLRRGMPAIVDPVRVDLTFYFKGKPDRWGQPHAIRPDKDNIEKLVLDLLKKSGVLADDCLVSCGETRKIWTRAGGVEVVIKPADGVVDDGDIGASAIGE